MGNGLYNFCIIYFILISMVSPEIQGNMSEIIYVLKNLCMLSSDLAILLLGQLFKY